VFLINMIMVMGWSVGLLSFDANWNQTG